MSLRTPLSRARGLGSAKTGLHHWIAQRVTAVALVALAVWFISALLSATSQGKDIVELVANPFHAVGLILFLAIALYHGALGVQVVVEDYVHCECAKSILIWGAKFLALVTAIAAILAILTFHLGGAKNTMRGYGERPCAVGNKDCHKKPCHGKYGKKLENCHKGKYSKGGQTSVTVMDNADGVEKIIVDVDIETEVSE